MDQAAQFFATNADKIIGILSALFLIIVAVIALTPRKDDDDALRGFIASLSPKARAAIGTGALATAVGIGAALLGGCGGHGVKATRYALGGSAHGLVAADHLGSGEARRLETRCDASATDWPSWRDCMRPAYRLRDALVTVDRGLRSAEAAVDARGAEGFAEIAPCVALSLAELGDALDALGARMPDELERVLTLAKSYGGACAAPGGA